jgi:hypothetical protein
MVEWIQKKTGMNLHLGWKYQFGKSSWDDSGTWIHGDSTFEKEMLC